MTTAIASARELHEHSSTFRCGIAEWVQERRCPLSLVDLLLEYGLEKQADCARWAATEPDRPVFGAGKREVCGPFPTSGGNSEWFWWHLNGQYGPDFRFSMDVPEEMAGATAMDCKEPTSTDAILWLLDHWKPTSAETLT